MIKKQKFRWNKRQAFKYYVRSQDSTALKKLLLWCSIGIIPFTVVVFILAVLCSSIDYDISTVILILGALCIPADIGFMIYSIIKFLKAINTGRCKDTKLTITNDACLLCEKYKGFVSEQGFLLSEIEKIEYYTECKQIVIYAPVSHYNPDTRKKGIKQARLDNAWCFTENHFKEDLLGFFESLNLPIDYIESGCFVENRKELIDLYNSRHLELVKSHEHIFVQDPGKTNEMMNQTLASRRFRLFTPILCILLAVSLFIMPIAAVVILALIAILWISKLSSRVNETNRLMEITNSTVKINTYSDSLIYKYTFANQGTEYTQSLHLSQIKKIVYFVKSRKLLIYANRVQNVSTTSNCMVIHNIFIPDLVEYLNKNIMSVRYTKAIYRWGW